MGKCCNHVNLPDEMYSAYGKTVNICKECQARMAKFHAQSPISKWHNTRQSAEKRGIEFNLTKEEFAELLKHPCAYGDAIHDRNGIHVGIDRKDNNLGYVLNNCVPCCSKHNLIKSDWFTYEEMLEIVTSHSLLKICGMASSGRKGRFNV